MYESSYTPHVRQHFLAPRRVHGNPGRVCKNIIYMEMNQIYMYFGVDVDSIFWDHIWHGFAHELDFSNMKDFSYNHIIITASGNL